MGHRGLIGCNITVRRSNNLVYYYRDNLENLGAKGELKKECFRKAFRVKESPLPLHTLNAL